MAAGTPSLHPDRGPGGARLRLTEPPGDGSPQKTGGLDSGAFGPARRPQPALWRATGLARRPGLRPALWQATGPGPASRPRRAGAVAGDSFGPIRLPSHISESAAPKVSESAATWPGRVSQADGFAFRMRSKTRTMTNREGKQHLPSRQRGGRIIRSHQPGIIVLFGPGAGISRPEIRVRADSALAAVAGPGSRTTTGITETYSRFGAAAAATRNSGRLGSHITYLPRASCCRNRLPVASLRLSMSATAATVAQAQATATEAALS